MILRIFFFIFLIFSYLSSVKSQTSYYIDYDNYDESQANLNNQDYYNYIWNLNNTFAGDPYNSRWLVVDFYDIVLTQDGDNYIQLSNNSNYTLYLDSVKVYYGYQSNGGTNLITFEVYDYNDVDRTNGRVSEVSNPVSSVTPLYAATKTEADLVVSQFFEDITFYPNLNFNSGDYFSIYMTNQSSIQDQFSFGAGYKENCNDDEYGLASSVPDNSATYTYFTSNNNYIGPHRYIFGNGAYSCDRYYIQNIMIRPYVRIIANELIVGASSLQTGSETCPGSSVQLNATVIDGSSNYSYSWSPTTGLNNPNIANPVATVGNSDQLYTVTVTDLSNNDTEIATVEVVSNNINVDAGNDQNIVCGSVVQLNAVASGETSSVSYQWSSGVSDQTIADPTCFVSSNSTYSVTVSNDYGCSATDNVSVSCTGGGGNAYVISQEGTHTTCSANFYDSGGPSGMYSDNEYYSITFESPNANNGGQVYVNFTSFDLSFGDELRVYENGFLVETYDDNFSPTTIVSQDGSLHFNFSSNSIINGDGWSAEVSCGPLRFLNPWGGGFYEVCQGESEEISVSPRGGTGNYTYTWSPAPSLSDPNIRNPYASPTSSTNYSVTVSDGDSSIVKDVYLNVNSLPDVDAGPDIDLLNCSSFATITATTNVSSHSAYWDNGETGLVNYNATPGQHVITLTDNFTGCENSDDVTVYAGQNQLINFITPPLNCVGQSVIFTNTSAKISGWTWEWNFGDGSTSASSSAIHTYTSSGLYQITLTGDSAGCSLSKSYDIRVNVCNSGNLQVDIVGDTEICAGESTTLTAIAQGGSFNFYNYTWSSPGNSFASFDSVLRNVSPITTTTYSVEVSNGANNIIKNVTVTVKPTPSVDAGEDKYVCSGGQAAIISSVDDATSYSWQPLNGLSCTNCLNPIVSTSATTTYTLTASNASGCSASDYVVVNLASTAPTSVEIVNEPESETICAGKEMNLKALISNGGNNPAITWKRNGNIISSAVNSTQLSSYFEINDLITVDVESNLGCANPKQASNSITVSNVCDSIVPSNVSLNMLSEPSIKIYPNPNTGNFHLDLSQTKIHFPAVLQLLSIEGKLIAERNISKEEITANSLEINVEEYRGVLFIKLSDQNKSLIDRVMIIE